MKNLPQENPEEYKKIIDSLDQILIEEIEFKSPSTLKRLLEDLKKLHYTHPKCSYEGMEMFAYGWKIGQNIDYI